MPAPDWPALLTFAHDLADLARELAMRWFRCANPELKDDRTPVTEADRQIEALLRQRIRERCPDHGIRGEEQAHHRPDAELCWVLDPIDGTKAFASGNPMFGCLIGLCQGGRPVLGVMDAPALHERWSAAPGIPAEHDGAPIRVRAGRPLSEAVLYCTTASAMERVPGHRALRQHVAWTVHGGDCIAYGLLAMGGCDLIVDRGLKPHDFAALVPIVEGAGGVLRDWRGAPLTLASDGDVIAAGDQALLHPALEAMAAA